MRKKGSSGKMDPKKKESLITAAIFGGMVLIIAAISIIWALNSNAKEADSVLIYKVDCSGQSVTGDPTYTFNELTDDQTLGDLKKIVGIVPILPTDGQLKNFVVRGAASCVPLENGEELTDDTAALVRMIDADNENRYLYVYVSRSDTLKIPGDYIPYGADPHQNSDAWSVLNGYHFKLYQVTFGSMDTDLYFALFTRGGRAWRIEFTGLSQEEVAQTLKEFFYSEAT